MMTIQTSEEQAPAPWVNVPASMVPDGARLELVRLADVVRWLMQTKRLQFVPAAVATHAALAGLAGLKLYLASPSGVARVVGAADAFGLDAPQVRRTFSRGVDMPPAPTVKPQPLPDGVTSGSSAALYFVRHVWGDGRNLESVLERVDLAGSSLAMPCEQAARLWGSVNADTMEDEGLLTYQRLALLRKVQPAAVWSDAMIAALRDEAANRAGQAGIRAGLATELGLTVSRIGQLLATTRQLKRKQPAKLQSVKS